MHYNNIIINYYYCDEFHTSRLQTITYYTVAYIPGIYILSMEELLYFVVSLQGG